MECLGCMVGKGSVFFTLGTHEILLFAIIVTTIQRKYFTKIPHSSSVKHLVISWHVTLSLLYGHYLLLESIVILCKKCCVFSAIIFLHGKEGLRSKFNGLFRLGVKEVGDIVDAC